MFCQTSALQIVVPHGIHTNGDQGLPSALGASRWYGTRRRYPSRELSLEAVTARVSVNSYLYYEFCCY